MSTSSGKSTTHLVAGFAGGLTSALALQPLDLLKTRVQQTKDATILSCVREITSIGQLWRGTLPSALRTSIGSGLYLSFLNFTRTTLANVQRTNDPVLISSSKLPRLSNWANLSTGMFARSVVGCITMPVTVLKVRYESNLYHYTSFKQAIVSIYRQEGARGFFNGVLATCARDAPYAGLYVLFYEQFKVIIPRLTASKMTNEIPYDEKMYRTSTSALINSSAAMGSAILSTTITAPFDTIKTCMQLHPKEYPGFAYTAARLLREDGPRRMLDGLSLRLVRKAMSAGIAWCIYEELIKLI